MDCLPPAKTGRSAPPGGEKCQRPYRSHFLALSKDNHAQSGVPSQIMGRPGGTGGQPVLCRIVALGGQAHLRRWCCSLVLLKKKSQRTRRPAPRTMPGAAAVYLRKEEYLLS